jgi:metallophosphoesterase (TIGR00282 family)
MKILAIGDVTSPRGVDHLEKNLWRVRRENGIDFCVVNGENASFITGISPELAEVLLKSGADVISGGNHTLRNTRTFNYLDDEAAILRPINFGDSAPGRGYTIADANGYRMLVISALGNVHVEPNLDSPFRYIDKVLRDEAGKYDFAILDIHAEATGEKLAIAHAYDGVINIIFGTHTHVPTADEQVLPRGTGYITDVGMCGESGGILGMDPDRVVERMRTHVLNKFIPSSGEVVAEGALFDIDPSTKVIKGIELVTF